MPVGHKDPGSIVAEIEMTRTLHDGAFLLLEGVDEIRFWTPRRRSECELIDGEGKCNVVGAIQQLDADEFFGALAIVDDDYDSILGGTFESDNLARTDAHDLECLLCRSTALDVVLGEYGDETKIRSFETRTGLDVRTGLLERALVFGRLRLAAIFDGLDIDSKAIRVPRFVDYDTWSVDGDLLIQTVVRQGSSDSEDEVRSSIATLPEFDPWRVARGHDIVELLRIGLVRVLGNIPANVGTQHIQRILRSALTPQELQSTFLWNDIRAWELRNGEYRILKED